MNCFTKNIPNAITCCNITFGTLAIIFALRPDVATTPGLTGIQWAYVFIGLAAIADFMDGFAARALRAYSDMGKELDSLCDAVSFGVAPAAILYTVMNQYATTPWLCWLAVLIPVAGVLRLAKFNIDTRQTTSFIGLPIPANALFWIGYTSLIIQDNELLANPLIFIPALLAECWMMISQVKLFSLKFKTWGWKGNQKRWLLIIATPLLLCTGVSGLTAVILLYIAISLISEK